jgi:DNA-binding IclR family transcriptional regulator
MTTDQCGLPGVTSLTTTIAEVADDAVSRRFSERTAVDKALEVLAAFPTGGEPIGVSELARSLGLSKSTVFRLVSALERHGLVERDNGAYRLGRRLHDLGARVVERSPGLLHDVLWPVMGRLRGRTGSTVHLGVLYDDEVVLIGRLPGQHPAPATLAVGSRFPAHCSALGRAVLAHLPDRADEVVRAGLRPRTATTVTGAPAFLERLATVRTDGVAVVSDEARAGLTCVATALLDRAGRPIAALSLGTATAGGHDARLLAHELRLARSEASALVRRWVTEGRRDDPVAEAAPPGRSARQVDLVG